MFKKLLSAAAILACSVIYSGDMVFETAPALQVKYKGKTVVSSDRLLIDQKIVPLKDSRTETIKGGRVVNSFDTVDNIKFRREVALRENDSEIEITFQAFVPAYHPLTETDKDNHTRRKSLRYQLIIPADIFTGCKYTAHIGRSGKPQVISGKLDRKSNLNKSVRHISLVKDGQNLVYDANPKGVGSQGSGWHLEREGKEWIFSIALTPRFCGGTLTGKMVIMTGDENSYDKDHAYRKYSYFDRMGSEYRFVFGAEKFGKFYTQAANAVFGGKQKFGWVNTPVFKKLKFAPEGALYSAVAGSKPALFRVSGLRNGVYMMSVNTGNGSNKAVKPMTLKCNGKVIADKITVKPQSVNVIAFPVWVENGVADFEFSGNWQLSTINVQILQTAREDYTFRRGYWVSAKGPYPGALLHNEHFAKEPQFKVSIDDYPLPEQGKEMALPRKKWNYPVNHAKFATPARDWRGNAFIGSMGMPNSGRFDEITTPEDIERRASHLENEDVNSILVNGLLARHTHPASLKRVEKVIADYVKAGRKHNFKVLDHQDYSLLWDSDSGFRVMVENTHKLQHTVDGHAITRGICPVNPNALKPFREYIKNHILATGIDGIMIDETCFHGIDFCGCPACRKAFFAETNWHFPVNELSEHFRLYSKNRSDSELWRTWLLWRQKKIGDFWVGVKDVVSKINPEFVVMGYTTHYGLTSTHASHGQGNALEQLARAWDFIGTEIMSRNIYGCYRAVQSLRKAKNHYRNSFDVPVFGLVYSGGLDWNVFYFGWALNNMNCQATWETSAIPCPPGHSNYRKFTPETGNMDKVTARPVADIAMIFSNPSRDWPFMAAYPPELLGTSQVLSANHIQHEFYNESSLNPEFLSKIKVLYLNNTMAMSDESWNSVKEFVRNGGTLFVTGRTGVRTESGAYRKVTPLADFFPGLKMSNKTFTSKEFKLEGKTYKLDQAVYGAYYILPKKFKGEKLMTFVRGKNELPALIRTRYGKGTVVLTGFMFGAPSHAREAGVGAKVKFQPLKDLEELHMAVLKKCDLVPNVWNPGDLPVGVLTSVYRDGKKIMVHFLNATGSKYKPGETIPAVLKGDIFPQLEKDIVFTVPGDFKQARAASPDFAGFKALQCKRLNGELQVTLPKELLKVYTVVHLE